MKKILEGIYLKDSGKKGNITTIMVGVHGNEFAGIEVLEKIMNNINILNGKIYFIYANLKAIKENTRFIEKNLNRCFLKDTFGKTYEEKRVVDIIEILDKSDYLLDIHNTTSFNSSLEMLITTHIDYSKYFNFNNIVVNIDNVHKGGSDGYMDIIGKKGFCIECGSINYGDKEKSKQIVEESIINFLKMTGNIFGESKIYNFKKFIIKMYYIYNSKTNNFKLRKNFKDFDFIKTGEIIAYDGDEKIIANKDSYILFPYNSTKIGDECFCLGN